MIDLRLSRLTPWFALVVLFGMQTVARAADAKESGNVWYADAVLAVFTVVVFIALLIILRWKAWKPILGVLEKREQTIHGAHADAQKLREEAQAIRVEWEKRMAEIQHQVRQIHEDARRLAEKNAGEITAKARADMQQERERLRREIELARDQALAEIWHRTADLATEVSSRALRRQINGDDQRRLIDEALGELKNAQRELAKT